MRDRNFMKQGVKFKSLPKLRNITFWLLLLLAKRPVYQIRRDEVYFMLNIL
jgi:hypothetical protein